MKHLSKISLAISMLALIFALFVYNRTEKSLKFVNDMRSMDNYIRNAVSAHKPDMVSAGYLVQKSIIDKKKVIDDVIPDSVATHVNSIIRTLNLDLRIGEPTPYKQVLHTFNVASANNDLPTQRAAYHIMKHLDEGATILLWVPEVDIRHAADSLIALFKLDLQWQRDKSWEKTYHGIEHVYNLAITDEHFQMATAASIIMSYLKTDVNVMKAVENDSVRKCIDILINIHDLKLQWENNDDTIPDGNSDDYGRDANVNNIGIGDASEARSIS